MATALAVAERQGDFVSATFNVNKNGLWQTTVIGIPLTDKLDPTKSLALQLEVSPDNGMTWVPYVRITWNGQAGGFTGRGGVVNPDPSVTINLRDLDVGKRGRIVGSIPVSMTFGLDISRV
jgi:hypothetical protein